MKEWFERDIWNVLAIAVPITVAVFILISEIRDINRKIEHVEKESAKEIKYVKEQSAKEIKYVKEQSEQEIKYVKEQSEREIEYLRGRIEDYRKEYNQKWVEAYKEIIDIRKDMKQKEEK